MTEPETRAGSTAVGEARLGGLILSQVPALCWCAGSAGQGRAWVLGRLEAGIFGPLLCGPSPRLLTPLWLHLWERLLPLGPQSCWRPWGSGQAPWLAVHLISVWSPQENCSGQLEHHSDGLSGLPAPTSPTTASSQITRRPPAWGPGEIRLVKRAALS